MSQHVAAPGNQPAKGKKAVASIRAKPKKQKVAVDRSSKSKPSEDVDVTHELLTSHPAYTHFTSHVVEAVP
jgi:hypothetical protein